MICIWCKEDFEKLSLEHGIPEGLACPPELELHDVACVGCNNALSRVDRALVKQFEMLTVLYGVRRKKGRAPTINSWTAVRSSHRADGPHRDHFTRCARPESAEGRNHHANRVIVCRQTTGKTRRRRLVSARR